MSGLTIPKGKGNKVVSCAECRRHVLVFLVLILSANSRTPEDLSC